MSWKSYAVVSGATVLAGWLASTPPANEPEGAVVVSRQPATPRAAAAAATIEHEADRLQVRVRREVDYTQPNRNPFRFGVARADVDRGGDIPPPAPVAAPSEPPVATPFVPPPPVKLSGIAEDEKGGQMERTAILSSPAGVLLVREGDVVMGDYRVGRIESEAVELLKTDGTTLRLTLSNPKIQ
jgi:hypothetical protein